ncbi:MAG TPA: hypothetical protein VFT84_16510 [Gemmatimonadales bacterium]|nr:hypothetical protein [Gemmatimonadales bacterium]
MTTVIWAIAYSGAFAVVLGMGGRHAGPGWELASLAVTLSYPLVLLGCVAHAISTGASRGAPGLGPLIVLLAGLPGIAGIRSVDGALHDHRFARSVPELEALLARLPVAAGERIRIPVDSLPAGLRDCCARLVLARRDSSGQLSATVLSHRDIAYLYDPTGRRLERGARTHRWKSPRPLAPDWYRVVRF